MYLILLLDGHVCSMMITPVILWTNQIRYHCHSSSRATTSHESFGVSQETAARSARCTTALTINSERPSTRNHARFNASFLGSIDDHFCRSIAEGFRTDHVVDNRPQSNRPGIKNTFRTYSINGNCSKSTLSKTALTSLRTRNIVYRILTIWWSLSVRSALPHCK